jgi:flagellar hook-associated protein FlgK
MLSVLNIAAGGLSAASARLNVTAGNIANLSTAGYKARRADLTASPAGVAVGGVSTDRSPGPVDLDGDEGSNVDLVHESVDLLREKHQYAANAKLIGVGSRLLGTLLDVVAK